MSQPKSPKTKKKSTRSETDTTAEIAATVSEIQTQLGKLEKQLKEAGSEVPPSYVLSRMNAGDLLLDVDIKAFTQEGETIFRVAGLNQFPRILDDSMLPESKVNFEQTLVSQVVRPTLNAFADYVNGLITRTSTPMLSGPDYEQGSTSQPNPNFISSEESA